MRKSHSFVLGLMILALAASALAADTSQGVVNINTADAAQLSYLPGVGVKAAQRIIDYRTEQGPFKKTTDLMQVKGFGDKTFERLSPYLAVDGKTTLAAKVKMPRKPRNKPSTTASK